MNIVHFCCVELKVPMSSEGRWGRGEIVSLSFTHTHTHQYVQN